MFNALHRHYDIRCISCRHHIIIPPCACTCDAHLGNLDGPGEEVLGLVHEELVQRPVKADVDGEGGLLPAPGSARLLP